MKRLKEARNIKVQPNKTGTSFMLGQSIYSRKNPSNVVFSSAAGTPYNDLADNVQWSPNPADVEAATKKDGCCYNTMKKSWPTNSDGSIIAKSWNLSNQTQ